MRLLFRNGTVFDGRRFLPAGTCVRVRGGRITGVGPAWTRLGRARGSAEPVDLDGGTLLPGFIDAHAHPVFAGHQLRRCDLSAASTEPEYLEIIARYAARAPGRGMDHRRRLVDWPPSPAGYRPGSRWTRWCRDRPVFLPNRDGHGAWVNSRALRLAGIDARTPDPPDGRIERDASGEPTGMLQEGAMAPGGAAAARDHRRGQLRRAARRPGLPAVARHHRLAGRDRRPVCRERPTRPAPTCGPPRRARCGSTWSARCGGTGTSGLEQLAGAARTGG